MVQPEEGSVRGRACIGVEYITGRTVSVICAYCGDPFQTHARNPKRGPRCCQKAECKAKQVARWRQRIRERKARAKQQAMLLASQECTPAVPPAAAFPAIRPPRFDQ